MVQEKKKRRAKSGRKKDQRASRSVLYCCTAASTAQCHVRTRTNPCLPAPPSQNDEPPPPSQKKRKEKESRPRSPFSPPVSVSPLQSLLLLGPLDQFPAGDEEALAGADGVHVALGDVVAVGGPAEVLDLLLGRGHPERVLVDEDVVAVEDELGAGAARGALAHLVREAKGLGHGQHRLDREEGRALLQRLGQDPAAPSREHGVDFAEHFRC